MTPVTQSSIATPSTEIGQLDRFQLLKILGEGAQGVVYLAFDPHLERQVAIKAIGSSLDHSSTAASPVNNLQSSSAPTADMQMLLREARTVSKFQHPNIVSIYEIGFIGAAPYLVLEYVSGPLLSKNIKKNRQGIPCDQAISLATQILGGLAYAHDEGIIHGDLKPANVLLTPTGTAKVTDFGIARGIGEQLGEGLAGSPRYMAPEYVSQQLMTPAADQFAAGIILFQLLTGKHPVTAKTLEQIYAQIMAAEFPPPSSISSKIDPAIDHIVARALSVDPEHRFDHINDFKLALEEYQAEQVTNLTLSKVPSRPDTLRTLRQRLRDQRDFPALSASISNMNTLFSGNHKNAPAIAAVIAKDIALTSKIMRIANSAYIPHAGGEISTLSHAVMMLGFSTVREIASSLMLIGLSTGTDRSGAVREQLICSLFSATLARKIAIRQGEREVDDRYLAGMFYRLGKLLTCFHLPELYESINDLIVKQIPADTAVINVLGYSYTEIGHEIAADWALPRYVVDSIQALQTDAADSVPTGTIYGSFSNDITDLLATITAPGQLQPQLKKLRTRYAQLMNISSDEIGEILDGSQAEFRKYCAVLKIDTADSALVHCLDHWKQYFPAPEEPANQKDGTAANPAGSCTAANKAMMTLNRGIQQIQSQLETGEYEFDDLIRKILATAYYGAGCQRVLLCRSRDQNGAVQARYAIGKKVKTLLKKFHFPLNSSSSMFHQAMTTGADIIVGDTTAHTVQNPIPQWYQKLDPAGSFLLFALPISGRPGGLIYLDHPEPHYFDRLPAEQLACIKKLRDLAVQAYEERTRLTRQKTLPPA
ncbi:MAG: protein kinase [Immundisolibacteraceae bacterium]|nr:protein kinase [Immundisolibacteraceae bacterium]